MKMVIPIILYFIIISVTLCRTHLLVSLIHLSIYFSLILQLPSILSSPNKSCNHIYVSFCLNVV